MLNIWWMQPESPQITTWRRLALYGYMRTHAHSECVILTAFPRQQWLRERTSMLRYTYIACLATIPANSQKKRTYFCHSLQTLLLTAWVSIPLEKLTVAHITYKLLAFYTLFSAVCQLTLTSASCTFAFTHFFPRETPFNTRWFKYDRDYLCVNKSQFVPVIFEPPCINLLPKLTFPHPSRPALGPTQLPSE